MLNKRFYLFFLLIAFGFFLSPKDTYGCGTRSIKSQKTCCAKEKYSNKVKKSCCKKNNENDKNEKDGCGGNCCHRSCSCPTVQISFIIPNNTFIKNKSNYFKFKKHPFAQKNILLTTGYYTIWIPPKIA